MTAKAIRKKDKDIEDFDNLDLLQEFIDRVSYGCYSDSELKQIVNAAKGEVLLPLIELNSIYADSILEKIEEIVNRKGELFLSNALDKIQL